MPCVRCVYRFRCQSFAVSPSPCNPIRGASLMIAFLSYDPDGYAHIRNVYMCVCVCVLCVCVCVCVSTLNLCGVMSVVTANGGITHGVWLGH